MIALRSPSPDLDDRDSIVQRFRHRIQNRQYTKLNKAERQALTVILSDRLIQMAAAGTDTLEAIQTLCQDEIALLEEGYPRKTLKSSYLPQYVQLLKAAIASGVLPLTELNSYQQEDNTRRHYALDFLSYTVPAPQHMAAPTIEIETPPTKTPVPVELEAYLIAVQDLIASNEPAELIAGIAAATGRDYTEVLSFSYFGATEDGHFNRITLQEDPYLLRFSSSGTEPPNDDDILTILPATDVLAAINKLWGEADVVALEGKPFEAAETQTLITQVDQVAYLALGQSGIVATFPEIDSISALQDLYLTIAIAYFCPQPGESLFWQRYMSHLSSDQWSPRYLLTHNQTPLASRGVLIPSQGQLPMHSSETEPPTLPEAPTEDEQPQAFDGESTQATVQRASPATRPVATSHPPPSLEGRQRDQALIESLLAVVKQQSQTIATLSETIAHLRADLVTARHGHPPGRPFDQAPLQALEHALQEAQAEQARLQSLAEDYHAKWREASQRLTQIYSVASPSEQAETSPDSTPEPTQQSPTKTTSRKKKRTTRKKATPRREKPGRPPADPKQSIVYRRAVRVWELTQQWNHDHEYESDTAIQISKSLLTRSFGVHAKAIRHFWDDFAAAIQAENERLGIDEGAIHFNKGDKLEVYINHVKPMLEQEGFYS